jgi:hypothetical protein
MQVKRNLTKTKQKFTQNQEKRDFPIEFESCHPSVSANTEESNGREEKKVEFELDQLEDMLELGITSYLSKCDRGE